MKAIDDKIIVHAIDDSLKKSASGLITDTREDRPYRGTVIAVGPGRTLENGQREEMTVKVGDIVFFTRYGPDELEHEGEKYYSIRQGAILAFETTDEQKQ